VKRYFNGVPCPKGHIAERRAHNGECVECARCAARVRAKTVCKEQKNRQDREYRERHKEAISSRRKASYAANIDKHRERERARAAIRNANEQVKERKRLWTRANRERLNALSREYKRANAEKVREAKAEYYRRNPHIARLEAHRRRARQSKAEGAFTYEDVQRIFKAQNGRCACCRSKAGLTIDHIVPLAKGGTNWPANLQGLCLSCNTAKQARDPIEFMQSRGALL